MDKSRKILAITGIRSDYDIMSEVFKQIARVKTLSFMLSPLEHICLPHLVTQLMKLYATGTMS